MLEKVLSQNRSKEIKNKKIIVTAAAQGIGRSTAGAILSIAFNNGTPILDGNVKRIIVRHFDLPENTKDKELWNYSGIMLSKNDPFIYTQGIMDVGAMICRPIDVSCNDCPVSSTCLQAFKPKIKLRNNVKAVKPVIEMNLLLCRHDNELLLKKIDDQEIASELTGCGPNGPPPAALARSNRPPPRGRVL